MEAATILGIPTQIDGEDFIEVLSITVGPDASSIVFAEGEFLIRSQSLSDPKGQTPDDESGFFEPVQAWETQTSSEIEVRLGNQPGKAALSAFLPATSAPDSRVGHDQEEADADGVPPEFVDRTTRELKSGYERQRRNEQTHFVAKPDGYGYFARTVVWAHASKPPNSRGFELNPRPRRGQLSVRIWADSGNGWRRVDYQIILRIRYRKLP